MNISSIGGQQYVFCPPYGIGKAAVSLKFFLNSNIGSYLTYQPMSYVFRQIY